MDPRSHQIDVGSECELTVTRTRNVAAPSDGRSQTIRSRSFFLLVRWSSTSLPARTSVFEARSS